MTEAMARHIAIDPNEADAHGRAEMVQRRMMGIPSEEQQFAIDRAADELQAHLDALEADAAIAEGVAVPTDPYHWLPTWYLGKLAELDTLEEAIQQQCQRLVRQAQARRAALEFRWGRQLQVQVDADLTERKGKGRSVNYPTGRAGYRATAERTRILIENETAAIAQADLTCPDAVRTEKRILVSKLLELLKATGELLPGTTAETTPRQDHFYAGKHVLGRNELPAPEAQEQLPPKPAETQRDEMRRFMEPPGENVNF